VGPILGFEAWWDAAVAIVAGTALGFGFGLIPGIGGRVGLILVLPIAILFDPYPAAMFLFAMHSVVHTSTSIPAIAYGVPSTPADVATVIDGYPLAKMGRAGEALGASLSASAIGGVLGAIAFLIAIPVARPLVTSFGPPEFFLLALVALTVVASLSREGLLPGLVVAILGALVAMVGIDEKVGVPRFAFGSLELWDGLDLAALVCGIFVVPEMLTLRETADLETQRRAVSTRIADVFRGMFVTLRHMAVLLRSTLYGIVVGLMPAVGSSVSVWLSYGHAARTTKSEIPFGKGAVAGVIASEAANNSKEGGAMIPTLFFGIPGSSSMAIMMAVLSYVGVLAGPQLLDQHLALSLSLGVTVIVANILAIPAFFAVVPMIVRLSALRADVIALIAVATSVTAALISSPRLTTVIQLVLASALGIGLKLANWPRAPFVLGFVVSQMAEIAFYQTIRIWGWAGFLRPISLALLAVIVVWLGYSLFRRPAWSMSTERRASIVMAVAIVALMAGTALAGWTLPPLAGLPPTVLALVAAGLCVVILGVNVRQPGSVAMEPMRHTAIFALYLAITPLVGLPAASAGFIALALARTGVRIGRALVIALVFVGLQIAMLSVVFDVLIEKEIVGRAVWAILGF
jgi:TctA family transporter